MYLDFFGLNAEPFGLSPNLRLLYPSRAHEEAMAHLAYGLERGEEIILITGMIGIGKTLAIQSLTDRIASTFNCVVVNTTTVNFREFLKLILGSLSCPCDASSDTADLINALKAFISAPEQQDRRLLLVVDEGQNLQPDVLESMRLLLNVVPGSGRNPVIVLAGQPGLEETINRPELRQLRQRIRVHYRMEPLTREETDAFVRHRLECCGLSQPLFTRDAIDEIHHHSGGVPRLVNHLADKALLSAFVEGKKRITKAQVDVDDLPSSEILLIDRTSVRMPTEPEVVSGANVVGRANGVASRPHGPKGKSRGLLLASAIVLVLVVAGYFLWPVLQSANPRKQLVDALASRTPKATEVTPTASTAGQSTVPGEQRQADEVNALVFPTSGALTAGDSSAVRGEVVENGISPMVSADSRSTAIAIPDSSPAQISSTVTAMIVPGDIQEYGIHVASFRTMDRAESFARDMAGLGHATVVRSNVVNGVDWRRVVIGPIVGRAPAESLAASMRAAGRITYAQILLW